jgi:hypothetical protein
MRAIRTVLLALVAACGSSSSKDIDAMVMVIPDAPPDAPPDAAEPVFDFSCMGNSQGTVSANVELSGFVAEVIVNGTTPDVAPAYEAVVEACKATSDTCMNADLLDTKTMPTQAMGCGAMGCAYTSSMLATGGTALDLYLKVSKGTNRPTYVFPPSPVTKNVSMIPGVMFTPGVLAALQLIGVDQDPDKAMMLVRVTDCSDAAITDTDNLSLSIKQGGQVVAGTTELSAGLLDPALAGTFIIFNVPVGGTTPNFVPAVTEVGGMYKTKALRAHEVKAFPKGTTGTQLRPGF